MNLLTQPTPLLLQDSGADFLAFDGRYYYVTLFSQEKILQLDENFQETQWFSTQRRYQALCYDSTQRCFWATSPHCYRRIFRLDSLFREVDSVCLDTSCLGVMTSLSYLGCGHKLLVGFACGVAEYSFLSGKTTPLPCPSGLVKGVLGICPGYLVLTQEGKNQGITTYLLPGTWCKHSPLPPSPGVTSLVYNPCGGDGVARIDSLLSGCYPKISSLPVTPHDLGFSPCICNHQVCQDCPCPGECCSGVEDVLQSIALVESALACILNAEGEKIQKMLSSDPSIQQMIAVNASAESMVEAVTQLESQLVEKLVALNQWGWCPPR